ncbi:uncharacterized protein EKO05_0011422 [Ascochyta rabiei]|uniref:uncharacterized protein n=1 Tax=Didymella rabiei TaxID=5454 RepID=UPI0021FE8046|nr:uncharacterized protein EKO05_0011422 [Ascochyta rabiei]UPX21228.1 hypothetical protein EKO05_0011422 [Ascochyta rabiei]
MACALDILDRGSRGAAGLEEADRLALLQAYSLRSTPIVIRIAVDLNLVDTALAHERPMTAAELAEKSNADVELKRSDFSNAPKQPPPDVVQIVSLGLLVILDVFHRRQPGRQETTYHSRLWPRSRSRLAPQQRRAATIVLHASHGIHAVLLRAQRITKPPWTRGTGPFRTPTSAQGRRTRSTSASRSGRAPHGARLGAADPRSDSARDGDGAFRG